MHSIKLSKIKKILLLYFHKCFIGSVKMYNSSIILLQKKSNLFLILYKKRVLHHLRMCKNLTIFPHFSPSNYTNKRPQTLRSCSIEEISLKNHGLESGIIRILPFQQLGQHRSAEFEHHSTK